VTVNFARTGRQVMFLDGAEISGNIVPADRLKHGSVINVEL
jgi:hypothetical protein